MLVCLCMHINNFQPIEKYHDIETITRREYLRKMSQYKLERTK